jgi:hypothetical protein
MAEYTTLANLGEPTLFFYADHLPADEAIVASGHIPNGYFWEVLAQYLAPDLLERINLDSEAGMFSVYGDRAALEELQRVIEPYLADGNRTLAVIREIDASGDLHLPQLWSASSRRRPPEHLDHPISDVRRCVLPIEVLKGVAPIDRGIRSSRHLLRASRPKKLRHAALP